MRARIVANRTSGWHVESRHFETGLAIDRAKIYPYSRSLKMALLLVARIVLHLRDTGL